MDDASLRIAVGLRLGTVICAAHQWYHCGVEVDGLGIHGISCHRSERRHHRHGTVNSIIHKALVSAKIPSQLEPAGLFRSDGKRPDGMTIVPWSCGQLLVWDATCPDTLATSYRGLATTAGRNVTAAAAEDKKTNLDQAYLFMPVAIATFGPVGPKSPPLVKELGSRIRQDTGEEMATSYLMHAAFVHGHLEGKRGCSVGVIRSCMQK